MGDFSVGRDEDGAGVKCVCARGNEGGGTRHSSRAAVRVRYGHVVTRGEHEIEGGTTLVRAWVTLSRQGTKNRFNGEWKRAREKKIR